MRPAARASCTVEALVPATTYRFRLISSESGEPVAVTSNVASGTTASAIENASSRPGGIWIDRNELATLPTSGPAWLNLLDRANGACGSVDLADQEQLNNVCILAKALVFERTGNEAQRADVVSALRLIATAPAYDGTALALGRELAAYVIAADLIGLQTHDTALDSAFRTKIRTLLTTHTRGGPASLVECHELRPNNWGTHCGASRLAVAAYLGDGTEIARVAQVFKGWLGDRSAYAGFDYGDLSWQCDPDRPVGINPAGCTRYGRNLDGVVPDDQRRAGEYSWPPRRENYVWEALQGAIVQAVILERAGYEPFEWEDQALRRAADWLHRTLGYEAEGDDTWQPHLLNRFYGTAFPSRSPTQPGKNMGWTDWTHG